MNTQKLVKVRDVMKKELDIVDGMQTVAEALKKMEHHANKALIIDKRHENDEYGIVMLSDIAKKILAQDKAPDRVNVYEIMSKPVITVDADMDIRYCARLFDQFGLSRAPVMENRKLVGLVSYTHMVLSMLADLETAASA
jgi:predicted transcriptional regulator